MDDLKQAQTQFQLGRIHTFGTKLQKQRNSSINHILSEKFYPREKVRNLGVIFDSDLSLDHHSSSLCQSAFCQIREFSRIRKHLNLSTSKMLAHALVRSRIDYCNSLFYKMCEIHLQWPKSIQNTLCRVVTYASRFPSITSPMKSQHWLPVKYRIPLLINLVTYKTLNSGSPQNLRTYLQPYKCSRVTRRSIPSLALVQTFSYIPHTHKSITCVSIGLAYSTPQMWNVLPLQIRTAASLHIFWSKLKTHSFSFTYPPLM